MRLVLIALLALSAASCRAGVPSTEIEQATAQRSNGPALVLKGADLTFNGKSLVLGADIGAWHNVLGPSTMCDGDGTLKELYCWNQLGFRVSTSYKHPGRVISLHIFLNQKPEPEGYDLLRAGPDGKPAPPPLDSYHPYLFTGHLQLDGARVDVNSTVLSVVKQNSYSYNCLAELHDCGVGPSVRKYSMGFITDGDLEKGTIYELEISEGP